MSEKLDGVRGYWDGARLLSRDLKPIHAPTWWLADLPDEAPVDGEIWCGRGRFNDVLGAVKTEDHPAWHEMRLMAFDLPTHLGTYEERQAHLHELADLYANAGSVSMGYLNFSMCEGMRHLRAELREVKAKGGEGLMLRQPGSFYVVRRTHSVLKVRCANNTELL